MRLPPYLLSAPVAVVLFVGSALANDDLGIQVPAGFEVSLYADDALAHDIYSMTIDSQGRVVVAGAGYVKILHDADADGRADRATMFSELPASGAHGMVFDGPDLICTGDNGVLRFSDADGDGRADGPPDVWTNVRHPEHGANGIIRGPDGCYYLVCGNDAGVSERHITVPRSPVTHPRSGAIVRFSADGKPLDVVAHGFRNPYDIDFDADGHLFTVDSDGERDHHLPWYAPTRLFDIAQGMEHGWLLQGWTRGWNRPASFFDSVERAVEIGRGSPTGLVVYRHRAFPAKYRGGVFSACWTLGRVYHIALKPDAASVRGQLEVFAETSGDTGFAPCDLAVGSRGELFVAIGGRRTRGSVFRIRAVNSALPDKEARDALEAVLSAEQPLASWSRARWLPLARQLGRQAFEKAAVDEKLSVGSRVRAIEVLVEVFGGIDSHFAKQLIALRDPRVRARAAWALSHSPACSDAADMLAAATCDAQPQVARAAWEALATGNDLAADSPHPPAWSTALGSKVRRVRAAAIAVARTTGQASYQQYVASHPAGSVDGREQLARLWINLPDHASELSDSDTSRVFSADEFQACLRVFSASHADPTLRLEAVRLMQLGLGDLKVSPGKAEVYTGYLGIGADQVDSATRSLVARQLVPAFPTGDAELDRELARLLGMLSADDPQLLMAIAMKWTADSTVEDDIHYLIVASLLAGPRSAETTAATARCLLGLHAKLDTRGQLVSRNWPQRVCEAFDELMRRDSALASAVTTSEQLAHPEHAEFVDHLADPARSAATKRLWQAVTEQGRAPTAEMVALAGKLPERDARPLVAAVWDEVGLHDAIVLVLAKHPQTVDREKFIDALSSPQPAVVERAARALVHLGMDATSEEMAAALRALKQACGMPKSPEPRQSLLQLLNFWTEENSDVDEDPDPAKVYVGWYKMFADYYPAAAKKLNASTATDAATWRTRLAAVDWLSGDVQRGRAVFERRACHRCHQVSGHLGPELKGAVARMSRDDLFTAIVDPNLEVAPAFQTTMIATNGGQVYHGLVVYESPESTLLQTGPDTTVRITNTETSSMRKSNQSLMPTGLLETLTDRDLSDLYAYLKTLVK